MENLYEIKIMKLTDLQLRLLVLGIIPHYHLHLARNAEIRNQSSNVGNDLLLETVTETDPFAVLSPPLLKTRLRIILLLIVGLETSTEVCIFEGGASTTLVSSEWTGDNVTVNHIKLN
jgi:hypothetical protein